MDPQETRIYSAVLISSFVLGVIILFFIVSIIRQQRRNLELHKKNILAEIVAQENERARIAHDLHDELGPLLSAVKMQVNSFDLANEEDKAEMRKTNQRIDTLMKRLREIAFDLMPGDLVKKGLSGTLNKFTESISHHTSLQIDLQLQDSPLLSEEKTVNLYRIIQEIVHNTVKHAQATTLQITLKQKKNHLVLSTHDNGVGFDYQQRLAAEGGIGLRSLKSRVEIMNGQLFVESQKGKGTSYNFQIPL